MVFVILPGDGVGWCTRAAFVSDSAWRVDGHYFLPVILNNLSYPVHQSTSFKRGLIEKTLNECSRIFSTSVEDLVRLGKRPKLLGKAFEYRFQEELSALLEKGM